MGDSLQGQRRPAGEGVPPPRAVSVWLPAPGGGLLLSRVGGVQRWPLSPLVHGESSQILSCLCSVFYVAEISSV